MYYIINEVKKEGNEKMKKIFINELETEKRNYIIKLNKKLVNQLQEELYESQMDQQYEASKIIMNDDALKAIDYHDNYNSFFYTLNNWRKFVVNIDADYLTEDARVIYDNIIKRIEELDNEEDSEKYYKLDDELETETKKVLKDVENYLHDFEDYPSEDDAIQYADEMEHLENYYIQEYEDGTSDNVIRLDIAYTETFI